MFAKSAAVALLASQAHAFWRMGCRGTTAAGRIDPIVMPGQVSAHTHTVHGAGNVNLNSTAEELLQADCTSCQIRQDKSAYWKPALYFQHASGEFEMVEEVGGTLVYYRLDADLAEPSKKLQAFPQDFRMIVGNPFRRAFIGPEDAALVPQSLWAGYETKQPFLEQMALGFNCLNYAQEPEAFLGRHEMPNKTFMDQQCTDGIRFELVFPSCWNGKDLDVPGHSSHMAFPSNVVAGSCPESHPVKTPTLFFETIRDTYNFKDQDGQFVLANGDPTGYGNHGDFIAAWEEGVLEHAIEECTDESGIIEKCGVFDLVDLDHMMQCKAPPIPEIADENVMTPMKTLPGNVKISFGPEPAIPDGPAPPAAPTRLVSSLAEEAPSAPSTTFVKSIKPSAAASSAASSIASILNSIPAGAASAAGFPTATEDAAAVADNVNAKVQAAAPTPAPEMKIATVEPVRYESTVYSTVGNTVIEYLVDQVTTWVKPTPTAAPLMHRAAHMHKHKHHMHHHGHAH